MSESQLGYALLLKQTGPFVTFGKRQLISMDIREVNATEIDSVFT